MKFHVQAIYVAYAQELQRAYARVIVSASVRAPHSGARARPGGSLRDQVLRRDLVSFSPWGFVYTPTRIGRKFLWWWNGTRRQPARGRLLVYDVDRFAAELEATMARQVQAEDQRTSR